MFNPVYPKIMFYVKEKKEDQEDKKENEKKTELYFLCERWMPDYL